MLHPRHTLLCFAVLGLVLSGCRTYGGYGTKPKTYQSMQKAVQSFEKDFSRAETDLQKLESAVATADTLQPFVEQFQGLLDEHESLLQQQRDRIERLSPSSTYRNLHAAYGATVTEQRLMEQKYQRLIRSVRATVRDPLVQATRPKTDRRYTVRPIGFPSSEDGTQLRMEQALRGL